MWASSTYTEYVRLVWKSYWGQFCFLNMPDNITLIFTINVTNDRF